MNLRIDVKQFLFAYFLFFCICFCSVDILIHQHLSNWLFCISHFHMHIWCCLSSSSIIRPLHSGFESMCVCVCLWVGWSSNSAMRTNLYATQRHIFHFTSMYYLSLSLLLYVVELTVNLLLFLLIIVLKIIDICLFVQFHSM